MQANLELYRELIKAKETFATFGLRITINDIVHGRTKTIRSGLLSALRLIKPNTLIKLEVFTYERVTGNYKEHLIFSIEEKDIQEVKKLLKTNKGLNI